MYGIGTFSWDKKITVNKERDKYYSNELRSILSTCLKHDPNERETVE